MAARRLMAVLLLGCLLVPKEAIWGKDTTIETPAATTTNQPEEPTEKLTDPTDVPTLPPTAEVLTNGTEPTPPEPTGRTNTTDTSEDTTEATNGTTVVPPFTPPPGTTVTMEVKRREREKETEFQKAIFETLLSVWFDEYCRKNPASCNLLGSTTEEPDTTTSSPVSPGNDTSEATTVTEVSNVTQATNATTESAPTAPTEPASKPNRLRRFAASAAVIPDEGIKVVVVSVDPKPETNSDVVGFVVQLNKDSYLEEGALRSIVTTQEGNIKQDTGFEIVVYEPPTVAPPKGNLAVTITIICLVIAMVIILLIGLVIALKRKQSGNAGFGLLGSRDGVEGGSQYRGQKPLQQSFDNAAYNKSTETVRIGS